MLGTNESIKSKNQNVSARHSTLVHEKVHNSFLLTNVLRIITLK